MKLFRNFNLNSIAYWLVGIVYVTVCTIVNSEGFMRVTGEIYAYALILAFGISVVEMRLAKFIGKEIAHKHWKPAWISLAVGLLLVSYLISQQSDIGFGLVILLLFLIGIIFGWGYEVQLERNRIPNLIKRLNKALIRLMGKLIRFTRELEKAEKALSTEAENQVEQRSKQLRTTVSSSNLKIEVLSKEKEHELNSIENLHLEISALTKRIYGEFEDQTAASA